MDNIPYFPDFSINEILKPDGCNVKRWYKLVPELQRELIHVIHLVQGLRTWLEMPIRINSSYRSKFTGSAHNYGKAIDLQIIDKEADYDVSKLVMKYFQHHAEKHHKGFRVFAETRNNKTIWFHVDRMFNDNGNNELWIAFPDSKGAMNYVRYNGKLPTEIRR